MVSEGEVAGVHSDFSITEKGREYLDGERDAAND